MTPTEKPTRALHSALSTPQIVTKLAQLQDWRLSGDGSDLAIEKTYNFKGYLQTIAFVNAVAFLAEQSDHHPELRVGYRTCTMRWSTHDVKGLSNSDFECAAKVDALIENGRPSGLTVG